MNNIEFKELFAQVAKEKGLSKAFGRWFCESEESIIVLNLEKSNFNNSYYLDIKIFIQGLFNSYYDKSKHLFKNDTGDVFRRQPPEYNYLFDLNYDMTHNQRCEVLNELFESFVIPFIVKAFTKKGIMELAKEEKIYLLPAVKQALNE